MDLATLPPELQFDRPAPDAPELAHILPELRACAWPLDLILLDPANARIHPDDNKEAIRSSLGQFLQRKNVVLQLQETDSGWRAIVRAGNGTVEQLRVLGFEWVAAVAVAEADTKAVAYGLADNRTADLSHFDDGMVEAQLKGLAGDGFEGLEGLGWDAGELANLGLELGEDGWDPAESTEEAGPDRTRALAERFGAPPFSVLDAKQGYWQQRRRAWLALGIRSEVGRGGNLLKWSATVLARYGNQQGEGHTGTSVFDPVLAEMAYRWWSPEGGRVLDPFAGGSVRGIVAAKLGRSYLGIELRPEQVRANRAQAGLLLGCEPQAPEHPLITDPEAITPVQRVGEVWLKRDDLFTFAGARGSKARAAGAMLKGAKGCTTAGNRRSPMVSRVARAAAALGIPARCHCADSKAMADQEADALKHGAEVVKHPVGYLSALVSKARKDAEERGWTFVPLGMESQLYVDETRLQAANIPPEAKRIVCCVGSGMALSSILHGLDDAGLSHIPVLGVMVGMDPSGWLDKWAPEGWRDRVQLVPAGLAFEEQPAQTQRWGIDLDPHYEAKVAPFVEAGDLFWIIACRARPDAGLDEGQEQKAWQKGYSLAGLKELRALYKAHEAGLIWGAFEATKERDLAAMLAAGTLRVFADESGRPIAALRSRLQGSASALKDFRGEKVAPIAKGALRLDRFACRPGFEGALAHLVSLELEANGRCPVFAEVFEESATERGLMDWLGLRWVCTKVKAASELRGCYTTLPADQTEALEEAEATELAYLDPLATGGLEPVKLAAARLRDRIEEIVSAEDPAQHYSSYNKRGSWSGLSIRSYGGAAGDIVKPSEMSRAWKKANPDLLELACEDTPLREALGEPIETLLSAFPGEKDRVRLLWLRAEDGEISRHADVTDRDAGTRDGKWMRVHVPIQTNPEVRFEQLGCRAERTSASFEAGQPFYLDQRKPHSVRNAGSCDRIHLVMDVAASPELREMLRPVACAPFTPVKPDPLEPRDQVPQPWECPRGPLPPPPPPEPFAGPPPAWIEGDSWRLPELLPSREERFDLLFSCPPYHDLERYSDEPTDLSAMDETNFEIRYRAILNTACAFLAEDAFAVLVVGNSRRKDGSERDLAGLTVQAMEAAGLRLWNSMVYLQPLGSVMIRAAALLQRSRKVARCHQSVLVFCKGDGALAAAKWGEVDCAPDPAPAAGEGEDGAPVHSDAE